MVTEVKNPFFLHREMRVFFGGSIPATWLNPDKSGSTSHYDRLNWPNRLTDQHEGFLCLGG